MKNIKFYLSTKKKNAKDKGHTQAALTNIYTLNTMKYML